MIEKLRIGGGTAAITDKINEIIDHLPQEKEEPIDPIEPIITCEHGQRVTHLKGCQCVVCKRANEPKPPKESIYEICTKNIIKEDISINKIIGNEPTKEDFCWGHKNRTGEGWYTNGICNDCGKPLYKNIPKYISEQPTKEVPDIYDIISKVYCENCPTKTCNQKCDFKGEKIIRKAIQEISALYRKEV